MWRGKQHSNTPRRTRARSTCGFALYEVLLGVTVFVIGVLALGRAAENCMNASSLTAEEERIRQILANRMAEIQAAPGIPDQAKEWKIDTGYGQVKLVQRNVRAGLKEPDGTELGGISTVTLTAEWEHGGREKQTKRVQFYVYRMGQ